MSARLLHIVPDDKFTDMAVRQFECACPGANRYLLPGGEAPHTFVRSDDVESYEFSRLAEEIASSDADAVVFHSLRRSFYPVLRSVPPNRKIAWIGMGYDYYPMLTASNQLLLEDTSQLCRPSPGRRALESAMIPVRKMREMLGYREREHDREVLSRITHFAPVLDSEYAMVLAANPWFSPEYLDFNYGTVEDDWTLALPGPESPGGDVLVGNSADPSNNHLECFQLLSRMDGLEGRRVIVPLSYGSSAYRAQILACGRELLGDAFTPLVDFMPPQQYIQTLASCGTVLMNHLRQQALGNILISGMLGARICLNPLNPLYEWLQKRGVAVGSIETLDLDPLTMIEREETRGAIARYWGREPQTSRTLRFVESLCPAPVV